LCNFLKTIKKQLPILDCPPPMLFS